jgi:uncharacterized Zn-binding protein involved in type VI secretion
MSLEKLGQAGEATGGLVASAGRSAATPSPFDVWTNSVSGLAENVRKGDISSLPLPGVAAVKLGQAVARDWHRTSLEGFAKGADQQKSLIGTQLADLFHAGDHPPHGFLQHVGAAFGLVTSIEQLATMYLGMIPFPALPAVRIGDFDTGIPHAHAHPPNLIPPATVPIRLPSTGPVIPIPILSGAGSVLINNMPAARCGDMGLGIWCGGFVPMYEILLGSSNVWIEGCRAARLGVDVTNHCIFSVRPRAGDPPIGSFTGFTISSSSNVMIGGIPLPSLTSMAVGAAFKAMFKGLGKAFQWLRKLRKGTPNFSRAGTLAGLGPARAADKIDYAAQYARAGQLIEEMEMKGKLILRGDHEFLAAARRHLRQIACSKIGRKNLEIIHASPHSIVIEHLNDAPRRLRKRGPHIQYDSVSGAKDPARGSGATIRYDPEKGFPGSPPDSIVNHELGHGTRAVQGENRVGEPMDRGADNRRWTDAEEYDNINQNDNAYRQERGLPLRTGHNRVH